MSGIPVAPSFGFPSEGKGGFKFSFKPATTNPASPPAPLHARAAPCGDDESSFDHVLALPFARAWKSFWGALHSTAAMPSTVASAVPPPLPPMVLHMLNKGILCHTMRCDTPRDVVKLASPNWWRNIRFDANLDIDVAKHFPRLRHVTVGPAETTLGVIWASKQLLASLAAVRGIQTLAIPRYGADVSLPWSKFPALTTLNLTECIRLTDDSLRAVETLPRLTTLILTGCNKLSNIAFLSEWPALTQLDLLGVGVLARDSVTAIGQMKTLKTLCIGGFAAATVACELQAPLLECLDIVTVSMPVDGLAGLERCPRLKVLHLKQCANLGATSPGRTLCFAPTIESLEIVECGAAAPVAALIDAACDIPSLTDLTVKSVAVLAPLGTSLSKASKLKRFTAIDLQRVDGQTEVDLLEGIDVQRTHIETLTLGSAAGVGDSYTKLSSVTDLTLCSRLKDDDSAKLVEMVQLRTLHLREVDSRTACWAPQLALVARLTISEPTLLTNEAVVNIAAMPSLTELTLQRCCGLTDVRPVVTSPRIVTLYLDMVSFGNDTLGVPGESMRTLLLKNCPLFNDLRVLAAASSLRALHIVNMHINLSVAKLQSLMPHTRVSDSETIGRY